MEMIHVMIAFVIIMTMAVGTVAMKLYMFPEERVEGFQPLPQKVIMMMIMMMEDIFFLEVSIIRFDKHDDKNMDEIVAW